VIGVEVPTLDEIRDALVKLYRVKDGILRMYRYILTRLGISRLPDVKFYPDMVLMVIGDKLVDAIGVHIDGLIVITPYTNVRGVCAVVLHELYHYIQHVSGKPVPVTERLRKWYDFECDFWVATVLRTNPRICSEHFNEVELVDALHVLGRLRLAKSKLYDELSSRFSDILFGG